MITRLPSSSWLGCWWCGARWTDEDLFLAATTLDDITSAHHVGDGCDRLVPWCRTLAGAAGVLGITAEAVAPAIMVRFTGGSGKCFGCLTRSEGNGRGGVFCDSCGLVVSGSASGQGTFAFVVGCREVRFEVFQGAVGHWFVAPFTNGFGEAGSVFEVDETGADGGGFADRIVAFCEGTTRMELDEESFDRLVEGPWAMEVFEIAVEVFFLDGSIGGVEVV